MLSRREAAKFLRDEIVARLESGDLLEGEYIVRCKNEKIVLYARIDGFPEYEKNGRYQRFTERSRDYHDKLITMVDTYARNGTDEPNFKYRVEFIEPEVFDVRPA